MMAALRNNKKAMRKVVSSALASLSPSDIQEQSRAVAKQIVASPFFQRSSNVSCYLSMPTAELDTSALVTEILRTGKSLFVPKIDVTADGKMDFLKIYGEADLHSLPAGKWGIMEPQDEYQGRPRVKVLDSSNESLDLILVPGVAFDRSFSRLGHGKGYYDRFIQTYASTHGGRVPLLVALALREQILEGEQVPIGEHDWKMDVIVGPDGILQGTKVESSAVV
ncbi:hypothetical protein QCA50_010710 [Cerrena zonata]|uniref:5-formyltetrahydrofolate cyclo-ligase n=1 Tax=Cerrena zonata TaxID=2478898 RepID=A0AAW0FXW7_9APHY